ncbi:hypothetical protein [Kitasatospora indigofera]|uniref:hypothetical protein n=1 Tax=Kitasatospora indigofera TaxID=67307 RepID=UPI0036B24AB7
MIHGLEATSPTHPAHAKRTHPGADLKSLSVDRIRASFTATPPMPLAAHIIPELLNVFNIVEDGAVSPEYDTRTHKKRAFLAAAPVCDR